MPAYATIGMGALGQLVTKPAERSSSGCPAYPSAYPTIEQSIVIGFRLQIYITFSTW
jgi:hypothetical protein